MIENESTAGTSALPDLTDTKFDDINSLREKMWNGQLSATQLLQQAEQAAQHYKQLNSIAYADFPGAYEQAAKADDQWADYRAKGSLEAVPALLGIPISIKDLFKVNHMPMRAGTRAALPEIPVNEAALVTRLRAAGAIIFAKTNMHEIALGATGENFWTGDVKNPYDEARQSGGSSSGSAVAVATGLGVAAIGSDTGGSVRVPAAFCGVVGFKPSFGSIPLTGGLYLSPSFDHAGPITRNVSDARILYGVMASRQPRQFDIQRPPKFGILKSWLDARLAPNIANHFEQTIERLSAAGAAIEIIDIELMNRQWDFYMPIARAEAALVHKEALRSHANGFSPTVLSALRSGAEITAADYLEAQALRSMVRLKVEKALRRCDGFILPTSAIATPLRGQLEAIGAHQLPLAVRDAVLGQTAMFSALGLPAISIPCAMVKPDDGERLMPMGLQIVGNPQRDDFLLSLAQWVEQQLVGA